MGVVIVFVIRLQMIDLGGVCNNDLISCMPLSMHHLRPDVYSVKVWLSTRTILYT
jgi:hypothetical protein